jgi:hypothetical protein
MGEVLIGMVGFVAAFLVGLLGGSVAGFVLGQRANRRPPASKLLHYEAAVEAAWADGVLSAAARTYLRELESRLGIGEVQAEQVEREVMGSPKNEIESRPSEALERYRAALEVARVGKGLEQAVKDRLDALESEFGLSGDEADGIERKVLGVLKEEIEPPPEPDPLENDSAPYLAAVKLAWADQRLNRDEERQLSVLEDSLVLEEGEADKIEREVMGNLRERVVRPNDPPDEQWVDLVDECVGLVEELDRDMSRFDEPRQELADHTIWRLAEVLERSGVDLISDDETFDKKRHQPYGSKAAPDDPIAETLSPGFAVGRRVLRRARVRVE